MTQREHRQEDEFAQDPFDPTIDDSEDEEWDENDEVEIEDEDDDHAREIGEQAE